MIKKNIVWFEEVDKSNVSLVGGKGANLGEMIKAQLPVPYGFIVTATAYFDFIKSTKLEAKINQIINLINYDNPSELQQASSHIRQMIKKTDFPQSLAKEIIHYYDHLLEKEHFINMRKHSVLQEIKHRVKSLYKNPLLAVRSSATAEDLPTASFAGQQETYLNVLGESNLIEKIRDCWSSLFTERAIYYRHEQGFDKYRIGLAVVVQRMIQSEKSGISFSIDPVTNDKTKITIEAIFGLGEYIVGGKVTPDHYEIDKRSFVILDKEIRSQNVKLVKSNRVDRSYKLSVTEGKKQKLTDEEIIRVAMLVKQIEDHYQFPQDIEWAVENNKIYIVQSRPITTIKNSEFLPAGRQDTVQSDKSRNEFSSLDSKLLILTGSPASPGIASGPVKIIFSPKEISKINKGDILVAPQTNPDYVPAMKIASAIVTEKGGRTSHAAIVSRELGIPAVVGADKATKILINGMIVTVNGQSGEIYKGNHLNNLKINKSSKHSSNNNHRLKTITKIYANLAQPDQADKIAKMNVDGIGLLRAEFMIAEIGVHPKEFIRQKKQSIFINKLTNNLLKFVKPFSPRPVIYRATDFKTNEYRHLTGGTKYEPEEENPMLGFRGAYRYISNPDVFNLELETIANIWHQGYHNLHLMIPFVRTVWEFIKIKEYIKNKGLLDLPGFKLWIMVEVPAVALALEEFIKIGFDGVSIGTNDLTMMLLGVDRDNPEVADIYDERTPVVIDTLKKIVSACRQNQITCSICGQAASDYPDIVEELINAGITSLSVNPDAIDRSRELVYNIEKTHFKKK